MKKTLHTLLLVSVMTTAATADTPPVRRKAAKNEHSQKLSSKDAAELQARSLQLTCYLTDLLRLNSQQAAEMRRATLQELQEQQALPGNQALAHYDASLLRILSAGQYSTFRWLEDRQPVSGLLQSPFTVGTAQR